MNTTTVHISGTMSPVDVWNRFLGIVNLLDVTVLQAQVHELPHGAMSGTVILIEGHAAIHTVPDEDLTIAQVALLTKHHVASRFVDEVAELFTVSKTETKNDEAPQPTGGVTQHDPVIIKMRKPKYVSRKRAA